jgi:hypothetical protein
VELCDWGLLGLPIGVSWLCVTAPVAGIGLFARGALGVSLDLAKGVGQRAGTAIEHIKEHGKSTPEQKALAEAVKARLTNDILNKKAPAAEEGEGTSGQGHAPHEAGQQEASSSSSSSFAFPLQHKKKPDDNAAAKTGGGKHPQTR